MNDIDTKFKIIKQKVFETFDNTGYKEVSAKDYSIEKYDKIIHMLKIIIIEKKPEVKE